MYQCDACKMYIGPCYGAPGVGKTLSARHYTIWERVQTYWSHQCQSKPLFKEVSKSSIAFWTARCATPGHLDWCPVHE
jgi:DNA transposition AAA+ family ATPase